MMHDEQGGIGVRFVGGGDAFGSGGRFQACTFVQAASTRLLLDCGASSLVALKRLGMDPGAVDSVLVSHLHGDHFGGIPFLVLDGQFGRCERPLLVAGPPGLQERVLQAMEVLFPGSSGVQRRFAVQWLGLPERQAVHLGSLVVTAFPVVHPSGAPAYAFRLAYQDKVLAYSGDTEWTEALVEAAHGADLFLCECYTVERQVKFHLSYAAIRAHRARLGCRRLILTHLGADALARLDEIVDEIAQEGERLRL